jgi:hypothetical protein
MPTGLTFPQPARALRAGGERVVGEGLLDLELVVAAVHA